MISCRCIRYAMLFLVLSIATSAVAQELTAVNANSVEVTEGVHLLTGLACNVVAVKGPDGILLIDNGAAWDTEHLIKVIQELGSGRVRIAINTHFHFDHIGGNELLSKDGAFIVAHEGVRRRMLSEWKIPDNSVGLTVPVILPYPEIALPVITFADSLTLHFGGHEIQIYHLKSAHSDTDVFVFLREANVIHTGDFYLSNGFPLVDSFHGGTIDGLIAAVDFLIDLIDEDTQVVPGHGALSNRQELREYRDMISTARDRIAAMIDAGKSLEEIVAAEPTADLYSRGESWLSPESFVWLVYEDLIRVPEDLPGVAEPARH